MYTDMLVQQIGVKDAHKRRLQEAEKQEMIRFARDTRPARATGIRETIGTLLITVGEWLQASPAASRNTIGTRTELSQMKT